MIDARWDRERLKADEHLGAVPVSTQSLDSAYGRQWDVEQKLAPGVEHLYLRGRVLFVKTDELSVDDAGALEHGIGLGNDFLPEFAGRLFCGNTEDMVTRSVFIRDDVDVAIVDLT